LREVSLQFVVAVGFAALAAIWTYPLVFHLPTHLPGAGVGDNALFLWNFWWMRTARAAGTSYFYTSYMFAPAGADLTLHTHTALPAYVGATLLGAFSITTALNLTTLASVGIDVIESGGWLGVAPMILSALAIRHHPTDSVVRQWLVLGGVFFVWALGSHVHAAGHNTGLIMPGALLRYVPIAANARMPGRAMVVVYPALAVLAAKVWRTSNGASLESRRC
jgi:hypothetical protein